MMKIQKLIAVLLLTAGSLCANAQGTWRGVTGPAQKNSVTGLFRWNFGVEGIFSPTTVHYVDSLVAGLPSLASGNHFTGQNFFDGNTVYADQGFQAGFNSGSGFAKNLFFLPNFGLHSFPSLLPGGNDNVWFDFNSYPIVPDYDLLYKHASPDHLWYGQLGSEKKILLEGDAAGDLGYTAENATNKATSFGTLNNTLYPTTQAVGTALGAKADTGQVDVFLLIGQSNILGNGGDSTLGPKVQPGIAFQYFNGVIKPANDPVGSIGTGYGTMWPSFANAYYARTHHKILFICAAVGATAMDPLNDTGAGNWSPSGTLYATSNTLVANGLAAASALGYHPTMRGICWAQGETDATGIHGGLSTLASYKTYFTQMISNYRTIYGATLPFYIFKLGTRITSNWNAGIQNIQEQVAAADNFTFIAERASVDFQAENYMAADRIHWNQTGLYIAGNLGGQFAAANQVKSNIYTQSQKTGIGIQPTDLLTIAGATDTTSSVLVAAGIRPTTQVRPGQLYRDTTDGNTYVYQNSYWGQMNMPSWATWNNTTQSLNIGGTPSTSPTNSGVNMTGTLTGMTFEKVNTASLANNYYSANGTVLAKTGKLSGNTLVTPFNVYGYTSAGAYTTSPVAEIAITAAADFTSSQTPTEMQFRNTLFDATSQSLAGYFNGRNNFVLSSTDLIAYGAKLIVQAPSSDTYSAIFEATAAQPVSFRTKSDTTKGVTIQGATNSVIDEFGGGSLFINTVNNGAVKFGTGTFTVGAFSTNGGLLYTNASGLFQQSAAITGIMKGNGTSAPTAAVFGTDLPGLSSTNVFAGTNTFSTKFNLGTAANGPAGSATLVAGTVTVSNTSVTANSIIVPVRFTAGGTTGTYTYTVTAGTSFTITSSSNLDTSLLKYFIIN